MKIKRMPIMKDPTLFTMMKDWVLIALCFIGIILWCNHEDKTVHNLRVGSIWVDKQNTSRIDFGPSKFDWVIVGCIDHWSYDYKTLVKDYCDYSAIKNVFQFRTNPNDYGIQKEHSLWLLHLDPYPEKIFLSLLERK